jgi:branched-chain amino acid transport system ATP-binding protein
MTPLLSISDLSVSYKAVPALRSVNLELYEGEIRVILGANGAGKSTIIKSILGLVRSKSGSISLQTDDKGPRLLTGLKPHQVHTLGVSWVPEGRQLWGTLSVLDNLRMGAFATTDRAKANGIIEQMLDRFPRLRERQHQLAGSLSGGEQQMVALARALVSRPKLLLLDELSLGLAPLVIRDVFRLVKEINATGVSILLVEQNARQALRVADWAYLLDVGRIVESGSAAEMGNNDSVKEVFLGGHS